jgi:uncharacterized protein (TIGR00725 family)
MTLRRRPVLAVIGIGSALEPALGALCVELGRAVVDAGFRLVSGGLGGVMEAASQGARSAAAYREGDIVAILPSYQGDSANAFADIVIPTGLGIARNVLVVASADVVIAVGGGSGTLSEIAIAWQLGKPIVALGAGAGWPAELGGRAIDDRRDDLIVAATSVAEAVARARELVPGMS